MAAVATETSVNGNHAAHPNYQSAESYQPAQTTNASATTQSSEQDTATPAQTPSSAEIGWYFVEQYYTTMSKEPGKLFLFYTKKSQFVAGNEAEQVSVAVGPKKISEMIQKLNIQDCKVRVSNVDTQQSGKNILVQVIGEISNRAAPLRKFVQTFVLAEQPTGYYVLNDIFRYIADDEEEDESPAEEASSRVETSEPKVDHKTLPGSQDPVKQQREVEKVDKKLEKTVLDEPAQLPTVIKNSQDTQTSDDVAGNDNDEHTKAVTEEPKAVTIEEATKSVAQEESTQPEKPRDPEPTPSASPPKPASATPAEVPSGPPKPSVPKTWANLVASKGASASAAVPVKPASSAAQVSSGPKAVNVATKESSAPAAPASEDPSARPQTNGGAAWQNVGTDKQRQNRQHSQSISNTSENTLAYVKNVTEKVDPSALRTTLAGFGKINYFDVSRPKNCAFVEFADAAGYNACVSANPHTVSGEQVFVEERRPRNTGYGGNFGPRGGMRGGRGGMNDRPGSQGRGGFNKDGGRGGFVPRGRGGTLTPRGRGQPQAA